jgi:hypothetical protein
MKNWLIRGIVLVGLMFGFTCPAFAASVDDMNTVTVVVNGVLSISDTTGDFSLTFNDFTTGTSTPTKTVTYRVKGNGLPTTTLVGVLSAKIDALKYGIELQAYPGTYANLGAAGSILLSNATTSFAPIGTLPVNLCNKGATNGTLGKMLNGNQPIDWRAVATADLTAGSYPISLTVTLKDA